LRGDERGGEVRVEEGGEKIVEGKKPPQDFRCPAGRCDADAHALSPPIFSYMLTFTGHKKSLRGTFYSSMKG